jgi:hypothetical protein
MAEDYTPPQDPSFDQTTDYGRHFTPSDGRSGTESRQEQRLPYPPSLGATRSRRRKVQTNWGDHE